MNFLYCGLYQSGVYDHPVLEAGFLFLIWFAYLNILYLWRSEGKGNLWGYCWNF